MLTSGNEKNKFASCKGQNQTEICDRGGLKVESIILQIGLDTSTNSCVTRDNIEIYNHITTHAAIGRVEPLLVKFGMRIATIYANNGKHTKTIAARSVQRRLRCDM